MTQYMDPDLLRFVALAEQPKREPLFELLLKLMHRLGQEEAIKLAIHYVEMYLPRFKEVHPTETRGYGRWQNHRIILLGALIMHVKPLAESW
jgi:hypothetical protein